MPIFERRIPEGDNRERMVCADCGHIDYQNPKVVVGTVVAFGDRILMCRRAIEPRRGFWTLPAGYLELGETLEEGAAREAMEEATARISIDGILGVFSVSRIGQVVVIFRGRFADASPDGLALPSQTSAEFSEGLAVAFPEDPGLAAPRGHSVENPKFAAGPESQEVALFAWDEIPWHEIAFPTVQWALNAWNERRSGPPGPPARNPASDPRGANGITAPPSLITKGSTPGHPPVEGVPDSIQPNLGSAGNRFGAVSSPDIPSSGGAL